VAVSLPEQPQDPIDALIATSDKHFKAGQQHVEAGHLEQAKVEFDRALEVLLESAYGARTEPRIRDHFDRLVERISAYELTALAQGDGFTEKKYEPASIDELLELTLIERPPPTPELTAAVREDLETTLHDVPIPLNEKVLSYVELFQDRLRSYIEDGLARGSKYLPMIQNVFRAEGLPLDLAYIPLIESAFKPNALSRAKAKGVWQLMRPTAGDYGLRHDWYIDERSDPEKATIAAARHLKLLIRLFDGDWHLALASYNWGQGNMQRAIARTGVRDFWQIAETRALPRETREYVPMILGAIIVAKNPLQYGLSVAASEPLQYEKVAVPRPVDLRRVAEWTGSTIEEIQALNPELRRWTTPVRYPNYELKVPVGTASRLSARLSNASGAETAALKWHAVKRGDTLASIARRLGVSRADLAEANSLSVKSRVRVGQELVIPRAPALALSARADRPAVADQVLASSRSLSGVASPAADEEEEPREERRASVSARKTATTGKVIHRVKRGDTLFSIARLYKTTVQAIKSWNRIRGNLINPGDRLTIFSPAAASRSDQ
jgi:membrane-bound lytic murein transglycosylase D